MAQNIFKNITVSLLILSFVILPFLNFPAVAYAQSFGGPGLNSVTSQGIGGYMQAVGPMIPKLQGCGTMIKNGSTSGINAIKKLFESNSVSPIPMPTTLVTQLDSSGLDIQPPPDLAASVKDAGNQSEAVLVTDQAGLDALKKGNTTTTDTKTAIQTLSANQTCLNSVGKMISKLLLQRLTASTVAYINTGNFGDSFSLKNESQYFQDMGNTEILKFGSEVSDNGLYPFAQAFMQNTAMSVKTHFAQNAQYSLNKMIQDTTPQYTSLDFGRSFAAGGWSAWDAMTQVPANNPMGFQLMASDELSKRLDGTSQSVAKTARDYLANNSGFLGQQQCTSPWGMTKQQEKASLVAGGTGCLKWEYVTPGSMIAHEATKITDYPNNQFLNINDLNDAMAAVFDAQLNKWAQGVNTNGLANFSPSQDNQIDLGVNNSLNSGQIQNNIPAGYNYDGSWFGKHPNFDITKDLDQALIDEQRTYVAKLGDYDTALLELITWIRQLDYCIPGPNPDWQQISSDVLDSLGQVKTNDGKNGWQIASEISQFGTLAAAIPGIGTFVGIGAGLTSMVTGAIGAKASASGAAAAAADTVERILGVHMDATQDQISSTEGVKNLLSNVFNNYTEKINKIYFSGPKPYLPEVTNEGRGLFEQISGYQQLIENNQKEIIFYQDNIPRLERIKSDMDAVILAAATVATNDPTYAAKQNALASLKDPNNDIVKEFASLTTSLKDGNDIASVVTNMNATKDKTKHVRDDLLQGKYGCEKEMEKLLYNDPNAYQTYVRREPYPLPIPYYYAWPINDTNTSNILIDQNGKPTVTFDATGNVVSGGPYRMPYGPGSWSGYKTFLDMFNAFNADFNEHNFLFGSYYYSPQTASPVVGSICLPIVNRINNDRNGTSQSGGGETAATLLDLPSNSGSGVSHIPLSNGPTPDSPTSPLGGWFQYTYGVDNNAITHDGADCGQLKNLERSFNVY